jgi:hypothetical protein
LRAAASILLDKEEFSRRLLLGNRVDRDTLPPQY